MNGVFTSTDLDSSQYVEVDPTGRYGRYNEILGKGASKIVYRGFDEYEGIEVAWNQVKLNDFLQTPEDLERLYSEIHLLKTLKHNNIMKLYASWVDISNRNINFITEMFTSGTLRQYRLRHKRVNIRAVKHWCRQILRGLLYLHSHDPPVIHRDLKCDNIFVNGNQGEVKIGDLGLAAILRKSHADRCVGTPEFMAPEIYEEEYNELVDIYSFGMCILEMVTVEYPYSECLHPAQIYKKVISGKKPEALNKVEDPEVRQFVEKCLASVSHRLSASELLKDPFLQVDYYGSFLRPIDYKPETEASGFDLFSYQEDEHFTDVDITIKGKRGEADGIFFRLRIADQEGRIRNIYFPFDLETDTALSVANEMVSELDITDREVTKIADLIDSEISTLVPEWKSQIGVEEGAHCADSSFCHKCACYSSSSECVSPNHPSQCSNQGCAAAIHGRFEEITYQFDDLEMSSRNLTGAINHKESHENLVEQSNEEVMTRDPVQSNASAAHAFSDDFENEIRQELRWLRAKFHMQLREIKDQQLGVKFKSLSLCQSSEHKFTKKGNNKPPLNFTWQTPVHTLETIGESSARSRCSLPRVSTLELCFHNQILFTELLPFQLML